MTDLALWRPTRRRLTDTLLAALAPVAVCALALGGLSTWTALGHAGSPARVTVTDGRVFLPTGDTPETAAFFRITNDGGSADRLLKVTSAQADGAARLSSHRMTGARSAAARTVASVPVPAGASIAMSPSGLDVIVPANADWQAGDLVTFTLHFERGGPVKYPAVVVRPGQDGT
ncbi:copper chaperone PCu(A)C [Streptomyces sp. BV286]|uniref:copper chaperone PCu(A)C n=1 Tax=unclassified Streptomyces TaxID=2593676 RepID=UPI001C2E5C2F|nr:copper chaperone PCu(A)C [Streptomyces sp. BV286]MBV1939076.1 copper chaperone PCu(A)C [Streptomyces sp. BV286]